MGVCVRQKVSYLNIKLPDESTNCLRLSTHIGVVIGKINKTILRVEDAAMCNPK